MSNVTSLSVSPLTSSTQTNSPSPSTTEYSAASKLSVNSISKTQRLARFFASNLCDVLTAAVQYQDKGADRCVQDVNFTLETSGECFSWLHDTVARNQDCRTAPCCPSWCEGVGLSETCVICWSWRLDNNETIVWRITTHMEKVATPQEDPVYHKSPIRKRCLAMFIKCSSKLCITLNKHLSCHNF